MKRPEVEDPVELVGVVLPSGNMDHMAECLIEEYMLLGWSDTQLMSLFTSPFFQLTHQIYQARGDAYVRSLIREVRAKWDEDSAEEDESDA
jgi:hypothetical protein